MDSKVAELPVTDRLLTWFETNKTQAGYGAAAIVILGIILGYFFYHKNEQQIAAGEALTSVSWNLAASGAAGRPGAADAYLKVATEYPNSVAGTRALLLAGGNQFVEGKYDQAKATFDRCSRDYPNSVVLGEAFLGSAACLDAQGKFQEAATAYKNLIDRHPGDASVPQAKFALARIYEAQNNLEKARNLFEEVARADPAGSLGSEAGMRLEEMRLKNPSLFAPPGGPGLPSDSGVKSLLESPATNAAAGTGAPSIIRIEKAK
jgi:tetratricopeptide (TPR) repeat protein